MEIEQIRTEFITLHAESGELFRTVLNTHATVRLALRRKDVVDLEEQLEKHLTRFVDLDKELVQHTTPPSNINSIVMAAGRFSLHTALRDSARGLIAETADALGSLRNQLDFRLSMAVAIVSLLVAAASLIVAVMSLSGSPPK